MCFLGNDAVQWFMQRGLAVSKASAEALLQDALFYGLIEHVVSLVVQLADHLTHSWVHGASCVMCGSWRRGQVKQHVFESQFFYQIVPAVLERARQQGGTGLRTRTESNHTLEGFVRSHSTAAAGSGVGAGAGASASAAQIHTSAA